MFWWISSLLFNELLTVYRPVRSLRSFKNNVFFVPPILKNTYGKRSFAHAALVLWNSLLDSIRNFDTINKFKSTLKKYLFKLL